MQNMLILVFSMIPMKLVVARAVGPWTRISDTPSSFYTELAALPTSNRNFYTFGRPLHEFNGAPLLWATSPESGVHDFSRMMNVMQRQGDLADGGNNAITLLADKRVPSPQASSSSGGWTSLKELNYGIASHPTRPQRAHVLKQHGSRTDSQNGAHRLPQLNNSMKDRSVLPSAQMITAAAADRTGLASGRAVEDWFGAESQAAHNGHHSLPNDVKLVSKPILVTWT